MVNIEKLTQVQLDQVIAQVAEQHAKYDWDLFMCGVAGVDQVGVKTYRRAIRDEKRAAARLETLKGEWVRRWTASHNELLATLERGW